MTKAIGIDLGTTYTVVSVIEEGRPKIVPNAEGQQLTPSVVAFTEEGGVLVGQPAKSQAASNPTGTVFSIKRRMGSDLKVRTAGREYTPEDISSLILAKVKADAEAQLGEEIGQAVITVPAYFNDRQRQATRRAGVLAGLEVIRIINEPTAAALAYGLEREDVHTVLVWDLGGGTFDVSILELGAGIFEVKAVSGDTRLGGDDIDKRVMEYLAQPIGLDLGEHPALQQTLREAAEKAKIQLSSSRTARIHLPAMGRLRLPSLEVDLTRERLESLIQDLLARMLTATEQALRDARLTPGDIDRVILVGGATQTPAVRDLAKKALEREPYRYIDPEKVVAMGAAIQAGMLLGLVDKAVLLDVLPLSLGVETQGGLMARVIPRNTPLPASGARIFTTAADYQTSMDIHVIQGERELALDNVSLGRFCVSDLPMAPRGMAKVEVAFEADVDGIVHVCATDLVAERQLRVKIASTKLLDPQEIDRLAQEARSKSEQDGQRRHRIEARIEAENMAAAAEMALAQLVEPLASPLTQQIGRALAQVRQALASDVAETMRIRSRKLRELLATLPRPGKPQD